MIRTWLLEGRGGGEGRRLEAGAIRGGEVTGDGFWCGYLARLYWYACRNFDGGFGTLMIFDDEEEEDEDDEAYGDGIAPYEE